MRRSDAALGMLEVHGMTAALAAADVMGKAAAVEIGPVVVIGDGLVTVAVHGDIAAVREALASGGEAAPVQGHLIASRTIGRPAEGLVDTFELAATRGGTAPKGAPSS